MFDPHEYGQMTVSKILPSVFAKNIAKSVDLLEREESGDVFLEQYHQLQQFQQMSISCSFEEALICFYATDLTDDQEEKLQLIYKTTSSWLRGYVSGVILDKLSSKLTSNKDFANSVVTILDQLNAGSNTGNNAAPTGKREKQLIVKLAQVIEVEENSNETQEEGEEIE